jgi:hypothetical protein
MNRPKKCYPHIEVFLPTVVICPNSIPQVMHFINQWLHEHVQTLTGIVSPGIMRVKNTYSSFIHNDGGRFNGIVITSQHEYGVAFELKGVKPSVANPTRTFRGSLENLDHNDREPSKPYHQMDHSCIPYYYEFPFCAISYVLQSSEIGTTVEALVSKVGTITP